MTALSRPVRRLLAIAILILALLAAWTLAVRPLAAKFAGYRQSIAQSRQLIAGYRRVGGARGTLERRLEEARRVRAGQKFFLEGASVGIVAAELQNRLKSIVTTNGGKLKSTQLLTPKERDGRRRVAIRVNMTAETEALARIFHSLESASPYLFLDNVHIRAPRAVTRRRPRSAPRRARAGRIGRDLRVRYDVFGYMQAGER